ncbi:hypothetical protein ASPZODRAFT_151841 [Penicilliopsis zonata CBS 506.65]|uniref:alpha-amylase n=1 Tax=Penicilliopsis zonata CBS 506.65 TaxID=1073090 RepID=A0A1L9SJE5_9EURO|nr:hypothetical protein ASPZODRAFT_151841 [Penicilliopsis zonata CBS 506.65]OJJ47349.1 hypothetical protein ASPZODRAFT_151841 [Penicilliopsis zonata CBS 506.65]
MLLLSILPLVLPLAEAASSAEWAKRSIYQVITDRFARPSSVTTECDLLLYCGGTYSALIEKLDYIQGMGFTAVQISPVNKQLTQDTIYGEAFHGYWPQNLDELNPHFGTAAELKNLSAELHSRSMYLLLDVVANEMAIDIGNTTMNSSTSIDYSEFHPFNSSSYYHAYCDLDDWSDSSIYTTCWLGNEGVATPTYVLTDSTVNATLTSWIANLVSEYDIDGLRLDGAKQIETAFIAPFVGSAGVWTMGEVDDDVVSFTCGYQNYSLGLENYPLYYDIIDAFTDGNITDLVDGVQTMQSECQMQYMSLFVENQDNPRFASVDSDMALAKNAMAFTILGDGIPKIYYGQEQHLKGEESPYNRQALWPTDYDTSATLYELAATLNALRNTAIAVDDDYVNYMSEIIYTDGSTYVTRKGYNSVHIVAVLTNQGSSGSAYTLTVTGAADEGLNMTEVFECKSQLVGSNGTLYVDMDAGQPRAFFASSELPGSGLCGYEKYAGSATPTASSATATATSDAWTSLGLGLLQNYTRNNLVNVSNSP